MPRRATLKTFEIEYTRTCTLLVKAKNKDDAVNGFEDALIDASYDGEDTQTWGATEIVDIKEVK